jgi:preprotein translocase subunit SecE
MDFFKKIGRFLREVRVEMEKVTWPGRDEVRAATIVIIALVVIMSAFIGAVDFLVSRLIELFFRL